MTIQRGQDWGRRVPKPLGVVEVADDAAAGELVDRARREGAPLPAVGLLGGDMRRTLGGGPGAVGLGAEVAEFTVDLGVVELDGRPRWFLSHLVARRSWWRGEVLAAMNAQFLGTWDVAPRGHPNDGRLDVVHAVDLPLADRWKAWRRLPGGTHLPHPGIVVHQVSALEVDLARPASIRLDGRVIGSASHLLIRAEPDALVVCI
jgi:hypothetical protein